MVRTCISLTEDQEIKLSKVASDLDRSQSWMVRKAVDEYLNRFYTDEQKKPVPKTE